MASPARVLCSVAGGKASGGLSRRGTKRAFQEPSQAFLRYGGPLPPDPSEDAQGPAAVAEGARLRGQEWGCVQGMEQASPVRGQRLQSRLAMLPARAPLGTISSELCPNLNSPPERMCVRSKKHRIQ